MTTPTDMKPAIRNAMNSDPNVIRLKTQPNWRQAAEDAEAFFVDGVEPFDLRTKKTMTWKHVERAYLKAKKVVTEFAAQ